MFVYCQEEVFVIENRRRGDPLPISWDGSLLVKCLGETILRDSDTL